VNAPTPSSLDWKPVPLPVPVTLRGRYVTLEPLDAERHTAALWQATDGHDELWTWLFDGPFAAESDLHRAIEAKQAAASSLFLAIVPAAKGQPGSSDPQSGYPAGPGPWGGRAAGWACYMRMEPQHGVIEVGNILLSPALQRTTAATEAMFLLASHIFDHLGYRRFEWKCNAENLPSRRAAERLGFTFEGIFRQHMIVKGRNRDTAWFSMLDREWPARKRAFETWLDPANFDGDGRQRRGLAEIAAALS
jgi:RimJ/RimL family protein N-acetyltransferase